MGAADLGEIGAGQWLCKAALNYGGGCKLLLLLYAPWRRCFGATSFCRWL